MNIIQFPEILSGCDCRDPERITLPVAPQAFARTRFCGEAKLPQAVSLNGGFTWIADLESRGKSIAGLDIDGPGDPLATWPMTRDILRALTEKYPELTLGLTTLGIGLTRHAVQLAELGVTTITLLVNAVEPLMIQNIYIWIRPAKKNIPLAKGAEILVDEQAGGLAACRSAGLAVTVLATVYTGVNEQEIGEIALWAASCGAESMVLQPGKGWLNNDEKLPDPSVKTMEELVKFAGRYVPSVTLKMPESKGEIIPLTGTGMSGMSKPTSERPNAAVLSSNGMDIDLHLGQAIKALIYGPREDGLACLLEARDLPEPGGGDNRWLMVGEILNDCFVLLAASAGQKPRDILGRQGLDLLLMEDNVEGTVDVLFGGGKKRDK